MINSKEYYKWSIGRAKWFLGRMSRANLQNKCDVLGYSFIIKKGVFSPGFTKSTEFFAKFLSERCMNKKVFEVGCGCGAISVYCALAGAKRVQCSDINSAAVECSRENVEFYNLGKIVTVYYGSCFYNVKEKYDIIFFGLPYVRVSAINPFIKKYGELAYSIVDEEYVNQRTFLKQAHNFIKSSGKVYVGFGKPGDFTAFKNNLSDFGWRAELELSIKEGRADNRIYRLYVDS